MPLIAKIATPGGRATIIADSLPDLYLVIADHTKADLSYRYISRETAAKIQAEIDSARTAPNEHYL